MEEFTKLILERVSTFETLDYFTLAVNLLLFVLSRPMAQKYSEIKDEDRSRARLKSSAFSELFPVSVLSVSSLFQNRCSQTSQSVVPRGISDFSAYPLHRSLPSGKIRKEA